jgi:hypothetical protein
MDLYGVKEFLVDEYRSRLQSASPNPTDEEQRGIDEAADAARCVIRILGHPAQDLDDEVSPPRQGELEFDQRQAHLFFVFQNTCLMMFQEFMEKNLAAYEAGAPEATNEPIGQRST